MIGVDTNVLVRYIVRDDERQYQKVRTFFERIVDQDDACFVSDLVLAELVWVLRSCYRLDRGRIAEVLRGLYGSRNLVFSSPDCIARAIRSFETGRADFADYLIRERALQEGCEEVATFDKALVKEDGFTSVGV